MSRVGARPWPTRWLAGLLLLLAAGLAQAATYSYRSEVFNWETAANAVTWDQTCTSYPRDDDKATVNLTGGFVFRFAGTDYSSVRILANGMVQFGADTGFHRNFNNTTLPAGNATGQSGCVSGATVNTLMAYWTDLNPNQAGGGNVTWEQKGMAPNRRLVVSWNGVYQYNTSTPYAVQIILYEGGEFVYQYGNANATGSRATIGVQVNSSDYTLYSYNSGYNANGTAIRWYLGSNSPVRVADYRFDEFSYTGAVGEVIDSSGNANHGVRVGSAASSSTGYICRGVDIPSNTSSTSSAIDTLINVPSRLGDKGSLSFFFRSNVAWSNNTAAMLMDASTVSADAFYVQRDGGGALRFRVTDSAGTALTATTAAQSIAKDTWTHIAVSWSLFPGSNQSVLRVYIDGVLSATAIGTTTGDIASSLGTLFAGDNRGSSAPSGGTVNSANGLLDELRVYNYDIGPAEIALDRANAHSCSPPVHHLEILGSASGVTCAPSTFTVRACSDASCSATYTGGMTGSLASSNGSWLWTAGSGFSIATGSSSTTIQGQLPVVASTTLSVATATPAPTNTYTCNFGSPSCSYSAAAAGFVLSAPDHVSDTSSTLTITAVKQSDGSTACAPAFVSSSKTVTMSCGYVTPASGTLPARLGGTAVNASGSTSAACGSRSMSLSFNAASQASLSLQYADVGRFSLSANYTGSGSDAGLSMTGSANVIAAPKDFAWSNLPAGAQTAGVAFGARVTARNNSGATTPNFGQEAEGVTITHTRSSPTGVGAVNGTLSGSSGAFSAGIANPSTLAWSEVGTLALTATLTSGNYLGSGLTATGSTAAGAIGPFRPHHFMVQVTPACGSFSYSTQPYSAVTVTARNAQAIKTSNYDGSVNTSPNYARLLTFAEASPSGKGSFTPATWAATSFNAGAASTSLQYGFTTKLTAPLTFTLRASDADGVSSSAGSGTEPSLVMRSGRLTMDSRVASASGTVSLPLRVEYWGGQNWLLASDDSCTVTPTQLSLGHVALSGRLDTKGNAASWTNTAASITLASGVGTLVINPPGGGNSGTVDVAINLGLTGTDRACLSTPRPGTTAPNLPWLRSRFGSINGCAGRWDSDPSARASFGVINPESQKKAHERQVY